MNYIYVDPTLRACTYMRIACGLHDAQWTICMRAWRLAAACMASLHARVSKKCSTLPNKVCVLKQALWPERAKCSTLNCHLFGPNNKGQKCTYSTTILQYYIHKCSTCSTELRGADAMAPIVCCTNPFIWCSALVLNFEFVACVVAFKEHACVVNLGKKEKISWFVLKFTR